MKHPLHLLFIVNSLHFGGAEKQVVSLLNNLDPSKFTLSLACLKENYALGKQLNSSKLKSIFCCGVNRKLDKKAAKQLACYVDENNVDIIVCTNQYPMLYGLWAKKISHKNCRVIEVFHTTLLNDLKSKLQWYFYKHLFKRCDHVVFVSKNQRDYWLNEAGMQAKETCVIHNGIDIEKFSLPQTKKHNNALCQFFGITPEDFVVGICAILRPEKKHSDLIDAIDITRQNGKAVKLLIIGDGPERSNIERHIKSKGLEAVVNLTGFQEDVRPYISICDCMAITSHSVETFSISALESMAMAKPMIMSNIGGASEQVTHGLNGFLFEKGDIATLAKNIELLTAPEKRKKMGEAALTKVNSQFTLENMTRAYDNLFSILHPKKTPKH